MCDKKHYDDLDERVTQLEATVSDLRNVTRAGLSAVNGNIETFSQQLVNMDKRIVEEKVKWGDVTRSMVKWTVRTLLAIVIYAAGLNVTKAILPVIFN